MERNYEFRTLHYIVRVYLEESKDFEEHRFISETAALSLLDHYYELGFTVSFRREQIALTTKDEDKPRIYGDPIPINDLEF